MDIKKILSVALLATLFLPGAMARDRQSKENEQSVGLVLSGGGAKGIAHVGVIKALEDNDIPIDYVTGTSMGAIVGSLYACGWSPERMMKLFTSKDFSYWSTGTIDKQLTYYFSSPAPTPQWASLNINFKDTAGVTSQILPTSLINPIPMNMEFLKLYGPYSEQCKENFDNLFVPFRCVCSDVYHKHKIVMGDGSLGDAVRASMSFPLIFRPIKINNVLVYDGGIYDNFPVNVMESVFNPDFIIGVSVSSPDGKPEQGNIYSQLEDMIIQNNDYSVPSHNGIKIQVPVLDFGVLEFDKAQTIYDIGYKTGMSMVDSIKKRVTAREPLADVTARREKFVAKTPELFFDSVAVTGAKGIQADYLKFLFTQGKNKPIDIAQTQNSYYRAVTDGTLSNLVPQAEFGKDGHNTLLLEATVKKPWSIGVGGWITSSTNSMLYLDLGFHTLSYNSLDVSLSGWIGQSYLAGMLSGKFTLRSSVPSYLQLMGVMTRQKFYDTELLFYENSTPTFITEIQNFIKANYVWAIGRRAEGYASLGWGYLSDSYFPTNDSDYAMSAKDKTQYKVSVARLGYKQSNLNNELYPSAGMEAHADLALSYEYSRYTPGGMKADGKYSATPRGSLELHWKQFFPLHRKMTIGLSGTALGTLQKIKQNYTATLIHAPAFAPTPSTRNYFNPAFRSDNYLAAGVMPVWSPVSHVQLRGDFYVYSPIRHLVATGPLTAAYNGWFCKTEFIGEVAAVYNFSFASLSIYGNYLSYPSRNWNFGINFGLLFQAPKILR